MPRFYKKTLKCGCVILALTTSKENDIYLLGGHNYYFICPMCKLTKTEKSLDDRLEKIYRIDYKITETDKNGWVHQELRSVL